MITSTPIPRSWHGFFSFGLCSSHNLTLERAKHAWRRTPIASAPHLSPTSLPQALIPAADPPGSTLTLPLCTPFWHLGTLWQPCLDTSDLHPRTPLSHPPQQQFTGRFCPGLATLQSQRWSPEHWAKESPRQEEPCRVTREIVMATVLITWSTNVPRQFCSIRYPSSRLAHAKLLPQFRSAGECLPPRC